MATIKQIAIRGAVVLSGAALLSLFFLYKQHQAIQAELQQEKARRLLAEKDAKEAAKRKDRLVFGMYAAGTIGAVSVVGLASYQAYKFVRRVLE